MKKMLLGSLILLFAHTVRAQSLWDQIDAAFVGNAKTAIAFTSHGKTKAQFLDNFTEIGHIYKTDHIAAIDLGGEGTIDSSTGKFVATAWTTGGKIHLAPYLKNSISLNPEWQFLANLELDARGAYDWTHHHPSWEISVAYPFK